MLYHVKQEDFSEYTIPMFPRSSTRVHNGHTKIDFLPYEVMKYVRTKASPQQQLHKVHSVTGWEPTTCSVVENAM